MVASDELVHAADLSNQFELVLDLWRVKTGAGLTTLPTGELITTAGTDVIPLYDYWEVWGEENAAIAANQLEYSYGNGATGNIGVPLPLGNGENWELVETGMQADVAGSATIQVVTVGGLAMSGNAIAVVAQTAWANAATASRVAVGAGSFVAPGSVIGFRTLLAAGCTDVRAVARFRQQIGTVVGTLV